MRQREDGTCNAFSKHTDNSWIFKRSEYPRLLSEWMAGKAFFTGEGFYGSPLTIKLGDISAVADTSPEHFAARQADDRATESEDAISGR